LWDEHSKVSANESLTSRLQFVRRQGGIAHAFAPETTMRLELEAATLVSDCSTTGLADAETSTIVTPVLAELATYKRSPLRNKPSGEPRADVEVSVPATVGEAESDTSMMAMPLFERAAT
jgi:hypothetical protein